MKNLMRDDIRDDYNIKDLQNIILNIADYIDALCQKYKINYRLMGGSALGAKRHGGFIPWDDDLDIFMTPSEYERFRDIFEKFGDHENFTLQELGESNGRVITAKLRLNNSYYEEDILKNWKIHHGIFVDIFILHTCPNNIISQYWQFIWAKYLVIKGLANKPYNRRGFLTNTFIKLLSVLPKRFLLDYGLRQVYRWRDKETKYFCNFLGKALFKKGRYKFEYFEGIKRINFEKIQLNVASNLEGFLINRFGDYMKIPSSQRIRYEQHASNWGIGHYDYKDRSDEKYLF